MLRLKYEKIAQLIDSLYIEDKLIWMKLPSQYSKDVTLWNKHKANLTLILIKKKEGNSLTKRGGALKDETEFLYIFCNFDSILLETI